MVKNTNDNIDDDAVIAILNSRSDPKNQHQKLDNVPPGHDAVIINAILCNDGKCSICDIK